MIKKEEKMRVRIAKERSDLSDLAAVAIKATYNTRNPGEAERCIDVLKHLKSLSLTVKDFQLSESIVKLDPLRRHRNPKIRREAQALFHSWLMTIYSQGNDNSFKASLTQFRLKPKKKHVLTRCSELKKKEERRSMARDEDIGFSVLKKKEDERSQILERSELKTDRKPLNLKRKRVSLEADAMMKKPHGAVTGSLIKKTKLEVADNQKMCYVASHSLQVTTKTLIPPPRRDAACKNIPRRPEQQHTETVRDHTNPKSAKIDKEPKNKKVEEMVELFEKAKKAADLANTKGVLLGKPEASRCFDALSLLMKINITPKPKEPRRMMERLEGLTKHKDRKICNAASSLHQLWRQRINEKERKKSVTKTFHNKFRKSH